MQPCISISALFAITLQQVLAGIAPCCCWFGGDAVAATSAQTVEVSQIEEVSSLPPCCQKVCAEASPLPTSESAPHLTLDCCCCRAPVRESRWLDVRVQPEAPQSPPAILLPPDVTAPPRPVVEPVVPHRPPLQALYCVWRK